MIVTHIGLKNADGFALLSTSCQSRCQVPLNNRGIPMTQFECALRMFDGFFWEALSQVEIRVDRVCAPEGRLGLNGPLQIRQGFAKLILVHKRLAQGYQRAIVLWIEFDRFCPVGLCLRAILHLQPINAKKVTDLCASRRSAVSRLKMAP